MLCRLERHTRHRTSKTKLDIDCGLARPALSKKPRVNDAVISILQLTPTGEVKSRQHFPHTASGDCRAYR
jgi:hypothetical protein